MADIPAFLEATLAGAPDGVVFCDGEARVLRANPSAERMLGVTVGGLTSCSGVEGGWSLLRADGEPLAEADRPIHRVLRSGEPVQGVDYQLVRHDGTTLHVRITAIPVRGPAGALVGAVIFLSDVTAQRRAEQARQSAEQSLRRLLERAPDPIVVHRAGVIAFANPAAAAHLGFNDAQEMLGRSIAELIHPDDRALVSERIRRMLQKHEPAPVEEERFIGKDGRLFTADVFALPLLFEGTLGLLAYGHDVAERKRAEAERQRLLDEQTALRERFQQNAAELEAILDSMLDGVFVADQEGRLTLANRAVLELLGAGDQAPRTLAELASRFQLRHPDGSPVDPEQLPLARALRGDRVLVQSVLRPESADSDRSIRSSAAPIRDDSGRVVAAVEVLRDITDLLEFDLLKDQFLRVVAHELKTPVTILKGYAQTLLRAPTDTPPPRAALEAIGRGADRIDRIVHDMLELAQLRLGELEVMNTRVDVAALVRDVAARLGTSLPRHPLHVETHGPLVVRTDPDRLDRVLAVLVDNAARYSPDGGPIDLAVSCVGGEARVSVRDRGVGIPREKQSRIFQLFYRAHTGTPHDYGGLGIGLYIASQFVARLGGRMWFESEEGAGSVFTFSIPIGDTDGA